MKKILALVLAATMFASPVLSTAAAVEPLRQNGFREVFENGRSSRRRPPRHDYDRYGRGRRRHHDNTGAWIAAGVIGAAIVGSAISSSNQSSSPAYVYEQPATVVVPSAPTYVVPATPTYVVPSTPTYVDQYGRPIEVDPNVYTYDANGNLVPYY